MPTGCKSTAVMCDGTHEQLGSVVSVMVNEAGEMPVVGARGG